MLVYGTKVALIECDGCGATKIPSPDDEGWTKSGFDDGPGTSTEHNESYYCPTCSPPPSRR